MGRNPNGVKFKMRKFHLFIIFVFFNIIHVGAQEKKTVNGLVFSSDSTMRLKGVKITNVKSKASTYSDTNGLFSIGYSEGDSIKLQHEKWVEKIFRPTKEADTVYLSENSIVLKTVVITKNRTNSKIADLKSLQPEYSKQKGIYYNGRPPISLLSPFGGSPITFFYELLSKNGRKVRKMNKKIENEIEESQVDYLFNTNTIQSIIPLKDEDVERFKSEYRPRFEEMNRWSTYDLHLYLKKSFESFKLENANNE